MDEKTKRKWVKALRSGKYLQSTDSLVGEAINPNWEEEQHYPTIDDVGYCCLGVLCDVLGFEDDEDGFFVPLDASYLPDGPFRVYGEAISGDPVVRNGKLFVRITGKLPEFLSKKFGLDKEVKLRGKKITIMDKLIEMNDNRTPFKKIADYIEKVKF